MSHPFDDDIENADWTKRTWDIRVGWKLAETWEERLNALGPMPVEHFLTLPAARAMSEGLRREVEQHGLTVPR